MQTENTIEVVDGHLAISRWGHGSPTVVLVHSGVSDRRMWDEVAVGLAERHTVISYDMRGFGESSPPSAPFRRVDDMLALFDALGLKSAVVAGSSFGGKVALEFAALYPERVAALALFAPPLPGHDWSPAMHAYSDGEESALEAGDIETATDLNMDMWVRGPSRDWTDLPAGRAEQLRPSLRLTLERQTLNDEFEVGLEPSVRTMLGRVTAPVMVAVGDADVPDFLAIARHLADAIPGARPHELPGVGHLIPVEAPRETARLIDDFLGTVL